MKVKTMSIAALTALMLASCSSPGTDSNTTDTTASNADKAKPDVEPIINGDDPLAIKTDDKNLKWAACPPIFPSPCEIAVLHGNPAQPNADVFLRIPGGYNIPAHWHTSAERMILVSGELQIKYQGAELATLTQGNYAYGPAKLPHRATCVGTQMCTLFIAFEGAVDAEPFGGELD